MKGENERLLFEVLNEAYPDEWVSEYNGIEGRKFRFDCANPGKKVAIEIEGGIWMGAHGGHTSGLGYSQNMEKYNLATIAGWRVLRYSTNDLKKTPWKLIKDVRMLCGVSLDENQTTLRIEDVKSKKELLQVRLS
jgi:hypothetical protein